MGDILILFFNFSAHMESRVCTKIYNEECYIEYCNTTETYKITCPCKGKMCNGRNIPRERELFDVLDELVEKSFQNYRFKRSNNVTIGYIGPPGGLKIGYVITEQVEDIPISHILKQILANITNHLHVLRKHVQDPANLTNIRNFPAEQGENPANYTIIPAHQVKFLGNLAHLQRTEIQNLIKMTKIPGFPQLHENPANTTIFMYLQKRQVQDPANITKIRYIPAEQVENPADSTKIEYIPAEQVENPADNTKIGYIAAEQVKGPADQNLDGAVSQSIAIPTKSVCIHAQITQENLETSSEQSVIATTTTSPSQSTISDKWSRSFSSHNSEIDLKPESKEKERLDTIENDRKERLEKKEERRKRLEEIGRAEKIILETLEKGIRVLTHENIQTTVPIEEETKQDTTTKKIYFGGNPRDKLPYVPTKESITFDPLVYPTNMRDIMRSLKRQKNGAVVHYIYIHTLLACFVVGLVSAFK